MPAEAAWGVIIVAGCLGGLYALQGLVFEGDDSRRGLVGMGICWGIGYAAFKVGLHQGWIDLAWLNDLVAVRGGIPGA